jgi:hypothetical protein
VIWLHSLIAGIDTKIEDLQNIIHYHSYRGRFLDIWWITGAKREVGGKRT